MSGWWCCCDPCGCRPRTRPAELTVTISGVADDADDCSEVNNTFILPGAGVGCQYQYNFPSIQHDIRATLSRDGAETVLTVEARRFVFGLGVFAYITWEKRWPGRVDCQFEDLDVPFLEDEPAHNYCDSSGSTCTVSATG